MILYTDENENRLIDFKTLKRVLNMKKSTLYRVIKDLDTDEPLKYKNQYLYKEEVLYMIMKMKLIEIINEYRKD
jgi:hypothetical protein